MSEAITLEIGDFSAFVYLPVGLNKTEPAQILLALHGMGGNGQAMGRLLTDYADRYHMVVVAPSLKYNQNWKDISVIAQEDPTLSARLQNMIDQIPVTLGLQINPKVILFGFSRGAQLAHRFAMFNPERVLAAAIISAGGYSLPVTNEPSSDQTGQVVSKIMPFPFGVGDISHYTGHAFNRAAFIKVQFVIEVGEMDTKSADVPRDYDPYLGNNRLERARTFYKWLQKVGVHATFNTFPQVGHEITPDMDLMAFQFFRNAQQNDNRNAA
jgi:predicted esterase